MELTRGIGRAVPRVSDRIFVQPSPISSTLKSSGSVVAAATRRITVRFRYQRSIK